MNPTLQQKIDDHNRRSYCTLDDAATILGCSPRTVRRRIAEGELQGFRLGRRAIRVDRSQVESLLHRIPTAGDL